METILFVTESMNRAVFFDRDGVINELVYFPDSGIVDTPINVAQVKLVFGVDRLINQAKKLGFMAIVISNQPTVGLNKIKKRQFCLIDKKIRDILLKKKIKIEVFYCHIIPSSLLCGHNIV